MSIHPIDRHIGRRIQCRRLQLGLTLVQLANKLKTTKQKISSYEHAKFRITAAGLWRMSQALDCEMMYFFEGLGLEDGRPAQDKHNYDV